MCTKNIFRLITAAAWVSIMAIAYVTLAHVGFVYSIYYKLSPILMRPEMRTYVHLAHIIAFAVVGALLASHITDAPSLFAASFWADLRFLRSCRHWRRIVAARWLMRWKKWLAVRPGYF
jgi:hypothetical protein